MSWCRPLRRLRRAAEAASLDADRAEAEKIEAERRRQRANNQAANARAVSERLRMEIEKNHWTELLQHAWGGR